MSVSQVISATGVVEQKEDEFSLGSLDLSRVINVTFMSLMETPDLSCVYRVRPGDSLRSIASMALAKRLRREALPAEIDRYVGQLCLINGRDLGNLTVNELIMLPVENQQVTANVRKLVSPDSRPQVREADVPTSGLQYVVKAPGLGAKTGASVHTIENVIACRRVSQPPLIDDLAKTVTHFYQGELSSSFLGLFRSFFTAYETVDGAGNLVSSRVEYDGFGTSIKFLTIAGTMALPLVRSVETKFDLTANLYESIVKCADGVEYKLITAADGKRSWKG